MANDLTPPADWEENAPPPVTQENNPFSAPATNIDPEVLNAGTVEIESRRATAEVQARMVVAKRFPRDEAKAYAKILQSCNRAGFADGALYSYKRGGGTVGGASIRLAEEMARHWGNIEYGIRELSRTKGKSEMQAYAWDLETNVTSSQNFTVNHIRDTRGGGKSLTDERDVYEITANMGARRLRARILAILPPDVIEDAINACVSTKKGQFSRSLPDKIKSMTVQFQRLNVTPEMLQKYLGHPIDGCTPDELVELSGVLKAISDKVAKVSDYFGHEKKEAAKPADDANPFGATQTEQKDAPVQSERKLPSPDAVINALATCRTRANLERLEKEVTRLIDIADAKGDADAADRLDAALNAATKRAFNNAP